MKKILLFAFLMLNMFKVNALSIELSCPSFASKGDAISVSGYLNKEGFNDSISAFEGKISYDGNIINLLNYKLELSKWATFSSNSHFAFGNITYDNLITKDNTLLFETNFKIKENASNNINLSIVEPMATDSNGEFIDNVSSKGCQIPILSNINTLSNISLSSGELSPSFNQEQLIYNTTTRNSTITINYEKSDDKSTVNCNCQNVKLNYGTNTIKITVISESNAERIYTINVNRLNDMTATEEEETWLSKLEISNINIDFDSDKTLYDFVVDSNISSVKISSTLGSNKYSYIDWEAEKLVNLEYGLNEINISIKSDTGDIKTYKINITRNDDRNNNNYLNDIVITPGNLIFASNVYEYVVNVVYEVDKIEITPKLSSNKSKYEIKGPDNLQIGENIYKIKVIAEDDSNRIYTIKVIRNKEGVVLSNIALLQSLNIEGYEINFKEDVFKYEIKSDKKVFNISAIPKEGASYYVLNSGIVNEDNQLIVRVTAEDGTINNYIINVKKEKKYNNNIKLLIIIPLTIVIFAFLVVALCIKKYNSEKNI